MKSLPRYRIARFVIPRVCYPKVLGLFPIEREYRLGLSRENLFDRNRSIILLPSSPPPFSAIQSKIAIVERGIRRNGEYRISSALVRPAFSLFLAFPHGFHVPETSQRDKGPAVVSSIQIWPRVTFTAPFSPLCSGETRLERPRRRRCDFPNVLKSSGEELRGVAVSNHSRFLFSSVYVVYFHG